MADTEPRPCLESSCEELDLLHESRKQFHLGRKLALKNIPVTTKEEVDLFLGEYEVDEIDLNSNEKEAIVTLKNGEDAESIFDELNQARKLDHTITICILATDRLLCLAHLPLNFTEKDLSAMIYPLGATQKCFMFRAEDTGESKGYGFVEFKTSLDKTKQIAAELDWREVQGHRIHCDVVSQQTSSSYKNLHSRCLLVDNLPLDYKDNSHFREIFSGHASPIYCQVVLKEGEPIGYGIIEYADLKDAQITQKMLNGFKLKDTPLRVTYCIPGKSAVDICSRLLVKFDEMSSAKPSLLPDPIFPNPSVLNHPLVLDLCDQHSQLMTQFKTALQQLQQTYVTQMNLKSAKPGLLGPAPSIGMSPLMNPNMQLGLIILLALQTQTRSQNQNQVVGPLNLLPLLGNQHPEGENSSILGDPVSAQANIILQNLMSQLSPSTNSLPGGSNGPSKTDDSSPLLQSLAVNIQNLNLGWLTNLGQLSSSTQFRKQINTGIKPLMKTEVKPMPPPLMPPRGHFDGDMVKPRPTGGLLGEAPRLDKMKMSQNFVNNVQMLAGQKKIMPPNEMPSLLDVNFSSHGGQGMSGRGGPPRYNEGGFRQSGYGQSGRPTGDGPSADHYGQSGGGSGDGYGLKRPNRGVNPRPDNQPSKGIKSLLGEPPSLVPKRLQGLGDGLLPEPGRGLDYGRVQDNFSKSGAPYQNDYKRKTYEDQSYNPRGGDNSSRDDSGYGGYSRHGSFDNNYSDSSFNSGRADSSFSSQDNMSLLSRPGSTSYDKNYNYSQDNTPSGASDQVFESIAAKAKAFAAASNSGYQDVDRNNGYSNYNNITRNDYNDNGVESDRYRQYKDTGNYGQYSNNGSDGYRNNESSGRQNDKSSLLGTPQGRKSQSRSWQGVQSSDNLSVNPLLSHGGSSHGLLATPGGNPPSLLSTPANKSSSSPHPLLSTPPGVSPVTDSRRQASLLGNKPRGGSSGVLLPHTAKQADYPPSLLGDKPFGALGLLKTPVGQKRSYSHLLPAPEPSPETEYIGQHSQGIGGHYADSYSSNKRQRLDVAGTSRNSFTTRY